MKNLKKDSRSRGVKGSSEGIVRADHYSPFPLTLEGYFRTETGKASVGGLEFVLIGLAAVFGGAVNALAGGGTLITFPALTAMGVPPVAANITNTVALCPGYLGGTFAQLKELKGQEKRLWLYAPTGMIFGVVGGLLLLKTGDRTFVRLVPYLILLATGLLAVQERLRSWLLRRAARTEGGLSHETLSILPIGLASIYGGYFGAGLSVIVLAVLGLVIEDSLTRLNAVKQVIAFSVNISTAVFFLFSGQVVWMATLVMAVGALIGGALGGRLAGRIRPSLLRAIVIVIGLVVAVIYFIK
ncbi:MAG TPA: sulfite exporter TauE/SafE family protein [Thermodesulfobacteriota bacterium]|nr:sulfite exporter TauE/SafE family protein [Thermodesulfobacteriota bacterium]